MKLDLYKNDILVIGQSLSFINYKTVLYNILVVHYLNTIGIK